MLSAVLPSLLRQFITNHQTVNNSRRHFDDTKLVFFKSILSEEKLFHLFPVILIITGKKHPVSNFRDTNYEVSFLEFQFSFLAVFSFALRVPTFL